QTFQDARSRLSQTYRAERKRIDDEFGSARREVLAEYHESKESVKKEFQEGRWTTTAVFDGTRTAAEKQLQEAKRKLTEASQNIKSIRKETEQYLAACRIRCEPPAPAGEAAAEAKKPSKDDWKQLDDYLSVADWKLVELKGLALPRYFKGRRLL